MKAADPSRPIYESGLEIDKCYQVQLDPNKPVGKLSFDNVVDKKDAYHVNVYRDDHCQEEIPLWALQPIMGQRDNFPTDDHSYKVVDSACKKGLSFLTSRTGYSQCKKE